MYPYRSIKINHGYQLNNRDLFFCLSHFIAHIALKNDYVSDKIYKVKVESIFDVLWCFSDLFSVLLKSAQLEG